jgi:hypothetical protein
MNKNFGAKLADRIANFVGSWTFIIIQSILLTVWVLVNVFKMESFDPYPFILMNLFLSFEAAYATPMILMSSNRQSERDRRHLKMDLDVDRETNEILKLLVEDLKLEKQVLEDHRVSRQEHEDLKNMIIQLDKKFTQALQIKSGGGL